MSTLTTRESQRQSKSITQKLRSESSPLHVKMTDNSTLESSALSNAGSLGSNDRIESMSEAGTVSSNLISATLVNPNQNVTASGSSEISHAVGRACSSTSCLDCRNFILSALPSFFQILRELKNSSMDMQLYLMQMQDYGVATANRLADGFGWNVAAVRSHLD